MTDFKKIPKVDLHYHLDGGLRPQTVLELAKSQSIKLPTENLEELKKYLSVKDDCVSLVEYLQKFDLPLKCIQTKESQIRVAKEAVIDAKDDGVKYIEVRFAPALMCEKGLSLEDVTENVVTGLKLGEKETGIMARAILVCMRNHSNDKNLEVIEAAKKFLNKGVCGVDLAGDEKNYPPEYHRVVFRKAVNYKIPITIHAGEAAGAENIREAIEGLGAVRIGHGVALKENRSVYFLVKRKKIPLEMCLTSNVQTKATLTLEEHPIRKYFDDGIIVTANTDNITVSNTTMSKEYELLSTSFGFSVKELMTLTNNAVKSSFLSKEEKDKLSELIQDAVIDYRIENIAP